MGRIVLAILATAFVINGCILERIFSVKNQLCDFENNFQINIAEGFRVLLNEPVMLDKDITWLTGSEPSSRELIGNELVMTYVAEKRGSRSYGQYDIPLELRFVRMDNEYRLMECYLSKNLTDVLTGELLTQIMQSVCRSKKSLANQSITIDIGSINQWLLPSKSELIEILGPPNRSLGDGFKLSYEYQLESDVSIDKIASIDILFDRDGKKILRIRVKYLRYHLDADFEAGRAILKVLIFGDKKI
jgi:hypothetical protein